MKKHFGKKLVSAILTATMLVSVAVPIAFAETPTATATNKKVRINAKSDTLLSVFEKEKEHIRTLEITDVSFDIKRDFDQSCYVTVKNTGTENVVFFLSVDNPYSDIYLGFIESGSATQPTLLTAGQTAKVRLSVFAQRAEKNEYTLPVKAYVKEGVNDILDNETQVKLNLPDEQLKFTCDLTSSDEETLEQNYMITNNGNSLSSVSIYADDTIQNYVNLTPGVSETSMKANESINIRVTPNFTAMKKDNVSKVSGNLVVSSAGKEQTFSLVIDTQGKEIHSITMKELVAYQKSDKQFFNIHADTDKMKESMKIENHGSDLSVVDKDTDYTISCNTPFIDENAGQEIANREDTINIRTYNGNEESGTVLSYQFTENDNGDVFINYTVILSAEDIKESIISYALDKTDEKSGTAEFEEEIDEEDTTLTTNKAQTAKLESSSAYDRLTSGSPDGGFDASCIGNVGSKVQATASTSFKAQDWKKMGATAMKWRGMATSSYQVLSHARGTDSFYNLNKVLDAPTSRVSVADKESYIKLGAARDWARVGLAATGLLLGLTGPAGWLVGGILWAVGKSVDKYLENEMKEIEENAGDPEEEGEGGGSDTYPNKRNQCTNAGTIDVPMPNMPDDPTDEPTDPPTDPPTVPTDPPTDPPTDEPTQAPTKPPVHPTDPTTPTEVPTQKPTKPHKNRKWTFYLKADPEPGTVNEPVTIWTEATIDISEYFAFKFSYRKAGSWTWIPLTENWVNTPSITHTFEDDGKYILRVVIKSKTNSSFWVGVERNFVVNPAPEPEVIPDSDGDSEVTFNGNHNMMLITTRLQAGDKSTNDKVMTTTYSISPKGTSTSQGLIVGKTSANDCSQVSMKLVDMTDTVSTLKFRSTGGGGGGGNSYMLSARYSTLPTHFRTVSDMEIVNYYRPDTIINYVGDLSNYRDVTLKSDFAVYEENIYVDGNFYVNEPTTLHCDVYNRNLAGGWVDIVVKDGDEVIYSTQDKWLGRMATEKIEIPWTPKTKDSQISVTLTNKSQVTKEFAQDNNFAERQLTAIEYQVPVISDIQSTLALEDRTFAVSTDVRNINNLTDVKMYLDGTEITSLQSSLSKEINKYWYNCAGLKAGSHNVKLLATYEKAGGKFDIAEKSLDFEVISASKSSATVVKNASTNNTNTSADIYNGSNYVGTYTPDETGNITVPFTADMYKSTSSYKLVVNTTKGIWITDLKAGTVKVNNNDVQNTFNVNGLSNFRYANLYVKGADSDYYKQISYNTLNKRGMCVVYFGSEAYSQFTNAKDAYLLVVTNSGKMHQLWIIKNGVRITDSNSSVTVSKENVYNPLLSTAKAVGTLVANATQGSSTAVLKSGWNTSYQGKADIVVSAFGSEVLHQQSTNGKTVALPYNDYLVDYTLKSDNYVFEVEKAMTLDTENVTNRVENNFTGKISTEESAEVKSEISLNVYDMTDKNGNQLKYVSAINNRPVTVTVTFTDTKDSSNVVKKAVKFNNFDGSIANVSVPEKAGEYKVSISIALITETTRLGDLNSDGRINGTDVALMKKFVYGIQTPTAKQRLVADLDGSGTIDKEDLNLLKDML